MDHSECETIEKGKMDIEMGENGEAISPSRTKKDNKVGKPKRRRRLTSEVRRCKCKKCGTIYVCDSKYGTSNLKRHLASCLKTRTYDVGQLISRSEGLGTRPVQFDQDKFRELLVHAIIRHELPLSFVEYEGVRLICSYLFTQAKPISRNTARTGILKVYSKELRRISLNLRDLPGRVCLTSDLWTSIATDGYMSLTAHFIDNNWVLHKRILNFSYMPPPHTGLALKEKIYGLLSRWHIENKLFSLTLDNAFSNDVCVDMLKNHLNLNDGLLGEGSFFHVRCCAHILNLVVQEGLKEIDEAVDKIRECVKYMKGSQARKQKFLDCVDHFSLDNKKGLKQDVPTRWNSTFLMLESAIYFRRAFCQLELSDSNFKHCPSVAEWGKVEKICAFLKVFYEATCVFSGSKYPTSNLYFPKVCAIQYLLVKESNSADEFLRTMATQMLKKFGKYWSEHCVILAIAVILDPRYKIQFVEFSYNKLYGEGSDEVETKCGQIHDKLFNLFNEYNSKAASSKTLLSPNVGDASQGNHGSDFAEDFDSFESQTYLCAPKSQLELYLDEPRVSRTQALDVLAYWKAQQYLYPELASMARDVLTIPISTVASESAFSIGGRVLDKYHSALRPQIVEALICSRDWLFGGSEIDRVEINEITEDVLNLNIEDGVESMQSSTPVVDLD